MPQLSRVCTGGTDVDEQPVEIAGEGVLTFRADDECDAQEEVRGPESERGGIQFALLSRSGLDGRPLWDGHSKLNFRFATDAEHEIWFRSRNAAIGDVIDIDDDLSEFHVFLVKVSDQKDDEV